MSFTEQLQSEILELVNCISDIPITSLTDDAAFEPLVALLFSDQLSDDESADEQFRTKLVIALIKFTERAIQPLLTYIRHDLDANKHFDEIRRHRLLTNSTRRRSRKIAAQQLGKLNDETALLKMIDIMILEQNLVVRKNLRLSIAYSQNPIVIDPLTEITLSDPVPWNRQTAIETLCYYSESSILIPLILALKDTNSSVAITALHHLAKIKLPDALPYLIEASYDFRLGRVARSKFKVIALKAIDAIHGYDTIETNEYVMAWYMANSIHQNEEVRAMSIFCLGLSNDKRAIPYLEAALEDNGRSKDYDVAISEIAQYAINSIDSPEALAALRKWKNR